MAAALLLALWAPAADAQRVRATVSAESVKVGERFTLSLTATHSFRTEAVFPAADAGPALFGDLEVIDRQVAEGRYLGTAQPGTRVDSAAYTVAAFAADTARIPSLPVKLVASGDTAQAWSRAQAMPIVSVVGPDAQGPRGLAPLAPFPQPVWPWLLLLLVMIGAALGLAYWWLRPPAREDAEPESEPEPEPTPYEVAMERLEDLKGEYDADDPATAKPYFTELSAIVRTYLARRFGVHAMERSTPEVVYALRQRDLSSGVVNRVQAMLAAADRVKFADAQPSPADRTEARQAARSLIRALEGQQRSSSAGAAETAPDTNGRSVRPVSSSMNAGEGPS